MVGKSGSNSPFMLADDLPSLSDDILFLQKRLTNRGNFGTGTPQGNARRTTAANIVASSGSGFGRTYCRRFVCCKTTLGAAAFSVRRASGDFTQTLHKRDVTFDFAVIGYNGLSWETDKYPQS